VKEPFLLAMECTWS